MSVFTGIIVYIMVWWVVIFAVLPVGHARDVDGTPIKPNLKKKLIAVTLISAVIWGAIYFVIDSDLISFRELSEGLGQI